MTIHRVLKSSVVLLVVGHALVAHATEAKKNVPPTVLTGESEYLNSFVANSPCRVSYRVLQNGTRNPAIEITGFSGKRRVYPKPVFTDRELLFLKSLYGSDNPLFFGSLSNWAMLEDVRDAEQYRVPLKFDLRSGSWIGFVDNNRNTPHVARLRVVLEPNLSAASFDLQNPRSFTVIRGQYKAASANASVFDIENLSEFYCKVLEVQ